MLSQPFDALAPEYDAAFTHSPIARHLRGRAQARLLTYLEPGGAILELGCGTGEDARFFGERGFSVTATDASPAMLGFARAKCADLPNVRLERLDLNAPPGGLSSDPPYALAFANFGVLNCVGDLAALAGWLAERLRPGGTAAFAVMAPLCLWEIGWHAAHGEFATAFRRLRTTTRFQPDPAAPAIRLRYPSVGQVTRAFGGQFRRIEAQPLGVFLPPSDVYGAVERRPRLLRALLRLDDSVGRAPWLANVADHYWIAFRRL
ncbi:MAG: methyltransferase domain-containing protein [Anaerolineae bacterium]|nr:methyltransferase domain-containing protein [Anaerolineae bacterium]